MFLIVANEMFESAGIATPYIANLVQTFDDVLIALSGLPLVDVHTCAE